MKHTTFDKSAPERKKQSVVLCMTDTWTPLLEPENLKFCEVCLQDKKTTRKQHWSSLSQSTTILSPCGPNKMRVSMLAIRAQRWLPRPISWEQDNHNTTATEASQRTTTTHLTTHGHKTAWVRWKHPPLRHWRFSNRLDKVTWSVRLTATGDHTGLGVNNGLFTTRVCSWQHTGKANVKWSGIASSTEHMTHKTRSEHILWKEVIQVFPVGC